MMMIPIYSKWTYLYNSIILYIYIYIIIDMISQMAQSGSSHLRCRAPRFKEAGDLKKMDDNLEHILALKDCNADGNGPRQG